VQNNTVYYTLQLKDVKDVEDRCSLER
jgi:hypothetical protein